MLRVIDDFYFSIFNLYIEGIIALSSVRRRWLNDTDKLVRAARHYERAEHIFVQHACLTVSKFITYAR